MARVLIAEDEEALRAFIARALAQDGHEVIAAADGGEALDVLAREGGRFELLLTDIRMPVMDGIALALAAARDFPDVTILLMTGYADQRERAHGLEALIRGVVAKPFTLSEIRFQVAAALADASDAVLPRQHAGELQRLDRLGDRAPGAAGPDGDCLVAGEAAARASVVKHPQEGAQNVQGGPARVLVAAADAPVGHGTTVLGQGEVDGLMAQAVGQDANPGVGEGEHRYPVAHRRPRGDVAGVAGAEGPGGDRFLSPEIETAVEYVRSGNAVRAAETVTGPLE